MPLANSLSANTLATVLILVSALLHALINVMAKVSEDGLLVRAFMNATALLIALPFTLLVPSPSIEMWQLLIVSMLIHGLYPFFLVAAFKFADISAAFPLARGSAPLCVVALALLFTEEKLTLLKVVGIVLISLAIASFALERGVLEKPNAKRGIILALTTGVVVAVYTMIDAIGVRMDTTPFTYIVWLFVLDGAFVTLCVTAARRHVVIPFVKRYWKRGFGVGIVAVITYGLALYALSIGMVAEIATLRETSTVFAAIIGAIFLHEAFGARRVIASTVIVAGVVLMQLGK